MSKIENQKEEKPKNSSEKWKFKFPKIEDFI